MNGIPKGLDLARSFYHQAIGPLIDVPHTACLIGEGSEVLGYDTERSTDHEWGPRAQLFVDATAVEGLRRVLDDQLPDSHRGLPTRWHSLTTGRVSDHIEVTSLEEWLSTRLPTIPLGPPDTADWLAAPQQHLLQLTAGSVFHDDTGDLSRLRAQCSWYPDDVWRWMISSQWHLIGNTEPFIGRAVEIGDHRGARLLTQQLSVLIMEMCYLQERRYRPYDKWFSRGFGELAADRMIGADLDQALAEIPRGQPDGPLPRALLMLAERHNDLRISAPVTPVIGEFEVNVNNAVRPYPVLNTAALINATVEAIADPALRWLPRVGSIDQLTHSDDTMINFSPWPAALADDYRKLLQGSPGQS